MTKVQELYARLAPEYDEKVRKLLRRWLINDAYYRRRVAQKLGLRQGDAVLDIGCGTGRNFQYLREKVGETGRIVGLDFTGAMLEGAAQRVRREGWKNVELVQGDASSLPLTERFDAAVSTYVMSIVSPYAAGLREAANAVRPGGSLAILDVQEFRGFLRLLNPVLAGQVCPYGLEHATCMKASQSLEVMKGLLEQVELEEGYLGMLYIVSGKKGRRKR